LHVAIVSILEGIIEPVDISNELKPRKLRRVKGDLEMVKKMDVKTFGKFEFEAIEDITAAKALISKQVKKNRKKKN
jgi:hypothetical protein